MGTVHESAPAEEIRLGPIKAVRVYTAPAPNEKEAADALGNQTVPFDEIKHLVADKPLARAPQPDRPA